MARCSAAVCCWYCDGLPFLRKPSVDDRIGPYLRDLGGGSDVFVGVVDSGSPFYAILRLFGPSLRAGAARLERILGGADVDPATARPGRNRPYR